MKSLSPLLLALLLAGPAAAQEAAPAAPEAHGISVLKAKWQKRYRNPALDEDPLRAAKDSWQLELEQREAQRMAALRHQGRKQLPAPPTVTAGGSRGSRDIPLSERRDYYLYEVKLSNTGTKKIRSLVWAYVLFDEAARREVGRHAFESKAGISAGKTRSLTGFSTRPPATVVDVKQSAKETPGQFSERVEIQRVVYDDGTVWERGRQ